MRELDDIIAASRVVEEMLRKSRCQAKADKVKELIENIPEDEEGAICKLKGLCHVKALGDIYLEEIPGFDWPNAVSAVFSLCSQYIEKHEIQASNE